jgi:hypothetical protein
MGLLFFKDKSSNEHSFIQHITDFSNISFTVESVMSGGETVYITKVWDKTKNFCTTVDTDLTYSQIVEAYVQACFFNKNIRICKNCVQEVRV